MRCPACHANLGQLSAGGEPMVRTRGVILKADGVVVVCPKCKSDVAISPDFAKAMQTRIVLLFRRPASA